MFFHSLVNCVSSLNVFPFLLLLSFIVPIVSLRFTLLFYSNDIDLWIGEFVVHTSQYTSDMNPNHNEPNMWMKMWQVFLAPLFVFGYLLLLCTHGRNTKYKRDKNPGLTSKYHHLLARFSHSEHMIYKPQISMKPNWQCKVVRNIKHFAIFFMP